MKNLIVLILALSLGACGTVAGLGKDVTDAADWSKEKISKTLN
jgi:predicted small secreted protein